MELARALAIFLCKRSNTCATMCKVIQPPTTTASRLHLDHVTICCTKACESEPVVWETLVLGDVPLVSRVMNQYLLGLLLIDLAEAFPNLITMCCNIVKSALCGKYNVLTTVIFTPYVSTINKHIR